MTTTAGARAARGGGDETTQRADAPAGGAPRVRKQAAAALSVARVQPAYVQVAQQLREQIVRGGLKPGERLPAETALGAMFGVSRNTAREALRLLAADKLVETRRGVAGGTFVVQLDPKDLESTLSTSVDLLLANGAVTLRDVTEVWDDLEILVAGLAARRRTAKQARLLLELSEPLDPKITDPAYLVRGTTFHQTINAAAGNPFLEMLLNPIGHLAREVFTPIDDHRREFFTRTNDEHRELAQAVADRDAERAMALMKHHNRYRALTPEP